MIEAKFVLCHLRSQARDLQSMLNYLESREQLGHEEYAYLREQLGEAAKRFKEMQRFATKHGAQYLLRAQWLN